MEPSTPYTNPSVATETTTEKIPAVATTPTHAGEPVIHHTKNLYPVVRHIALIICVLFAICLIIFLMHQNGKSIYDNGI